MAASIIKLRLARNCICRYSSNHWASNRVHYSSFRDVKKFYKNAYISESNGNFEINLDKRKLKTLNGQLFSVPSEPLALAVATEWNSQRDVVKRHSMYLTTLCNSALDNPTHRTKEQMIGAILHYLNTDTTCESLIMDIIIDKLMLSRCYENGNSYRVTEPSSLAEMQKTQWDPVVDWFNERYGVSIEVTTSIQCPEVPFSTLEILHKHLSSHTTWSLHGFTAAVETLKSFILTMAAADKNISVETALDLSRLETNFQTQHWGTIEWHHDIEYHECKSRLAAALLFIHFCSESTSQKTKVAV